MTSRAEYKRNWEREKVKRFRAEGTCTVCGDVRIEGSVLCDFHLHIARKRARKATKSRPWKAGRPGRPPVGRKV